MTRRIEPEESVENDLLKLVEMPGQERTQVAEAAVLFRIHAGECLQCRPYYEWVIQAKGAQPKHDPCPVGEALLDKVAESEESL